MAVHIHGGSFMRLLVGLYILLVACEPNDALSIPNKQQELRRRRHDVSRFSTRHWLADKNNHHDDADPSQQEIKKAAASKREMLGFAVPALGIYLTNPLLSNIDNAFVAHTVGTTGLAALSPATICTDQMLYLFSFLGRAATGIVSRAYALRNGKEGNTDAARNAGSAPLTASLLCGIFLSLFYWLLTPSMLSLLHVDPSLRQPASSYIYWRGSIAWAALSQSVCLSIMMATRDSITPLRIVSIAAICNVIGDALLTPSFGCAGAAAATAGATLISCGAMMRALNNKNLLPSIRLPTKKEITSLLDFTGPLLLITLTRLGGFIAMQRTAMSLGVQSLAGYQLCINLLLFFLLFGEPLSQLSQTNLPTLLDEQNGPQVLATLKSVLFLAGITALGIATIAFFAAMFGSGMISNDLGVQQVAQGSAIPLFVAVATAIFTVAVDGAQLASRDFGFMLLWGLGTFMIQLRLLSFCQSVGDIFHTFSFRLGTYALASIARAALGYGGIGRVVRPRKAGSSSVAG